MASAANSYEEKYANESFENETDTEIPEISDESESERELKPVDSKTLYAYARRDFEKHRNSQKVQSYMQYDSSSEDEDDVVISETIAEINTEPMRFEELVDTPRFGATRKNSLDKLVTERLQGTTKIRDIKQTTVNIKPVKEQPQQQRPPQQQQQQPVQLQLRRRPEEAETKNTLCVTEIVEEEEDEDEDDNEATSASGSEDENKLELTSGERNKQEEYSASEIEAEDEESIAEAEDEEDEELEEAAATAGDNDEEQSTDGTASEEASGNSEDELQKQEEEQDTQEDGTEAEGEEAEHLVATNEQRDPREARDLRIAHNRLPSIEEGGNEQDHMVSKTLVRHMMSPRMIAQKLNYGKQLVQHFQREQFPAPDSSAYGETETENEYEPRVQMHITSQTPTSFNSDDYAFHLNFVRKSGSSEKLRMRTAPSRKSWSFSNDRMREIERQNHILLKKILTQKPTIAANRGRGRPQDKFASLPPTTRLSSAAVNRKKQQRQIDLDNLGLKRRIEAISLRRHKQP